MIGVSFDSVAEQAGFADAEEFHFRLLSDPDQTVGAAYDAVRQEGEDYFGMPLPRRISYLINPEGVIVKAYDLAGKDLSEHAGRILDDMATLG